MNCALSLFGPSLTSLWWAFTLLLVLLLPVHAKDSDDDQVNHNVIMRQNPERIIQSVVKRFPPPGDASYRRNEYILSRTNLTGLPGNRNPCDPNTFLSAPDESINPLYLREVHHFATGRPWMMGRELFEWLKADGLKPSDYLLDFGCGALSLGIWAIRLLDIGHYLGVESNEFLFNAGGQYEIPLHNLHAKRPHLIRLPPRNGGGGGAEGEESPDYESLASLMSTTVGGISFDRVVAFSAFHHLVIEEGRSKLQKAQNRATVRKLLETLASLLSPDGMVMVGGFLPLDSDDLASLGLRVKKTGEYHCQWMDCDFKWFGLGHA